MFNKLFKKSPAAAAAPQYSAGCLLPRIKHIAFLQALRDAGVPAEQQPATSALCGELLVTYAFDQPEQFVMATPGLLARTGIAPQDAAAVALTNLRRQLPEPKYFMKGGCIAAYTGGGLEATLLLLDDLWLDLQPRFRGDIVVAAPHRDRLLMCDSGDTQALATLRDDSRQFLAEADDGHGLSAQLMVRRGGRWQLLDAS
ncbi:DUF1444 domain-containing protein [Aquincola sp. MAHUQ-54]|uniref:DUF1444 domain-containing protein n=1 Tax=Aquincola agrisoli TaxID=3119538 RepID=A0AAW9QM44_9BURK